MTPLSGEGLDGVLAVGFLAAALLNARPAGPYRLAGGESARIPIPAATSVRTARPVLTTRPITLLRVLTRLMCAEDLCCPAPVAVAPGDGSSLLRPVLVPDRRP